MLMMVPLALTFVAIRLRPSDDVVSCCVFALLGGSTAVGRCLAACAALRMAFAFTFFGMFFSVLLAVCAVVLIAGAVMLLNLLIGRLVS